MAFINEKDDLYHAAYSEQGNIRIRSLKFRNMRPLLVTEEIELDG